MLWTITIILAVLWVLGMVSGAALGMWIHLLLVFALTVDDTRLSDLPGINDRSGIRPGKLHHPRSGKVWADDDRRAFAVAVVCEGGAGKGGRKAKRQVGSGIPGAANTSRQVAIAVSVSTCKACKRSSSLEPASPTVASSAAGHTPTGCPSKSSTPTPPPRPAQRSTATPNGSPTGSATCG